MMHPENSNPISSVAEDTNRGLHCHLSLCPSSHHPERIPVRLLNLNASGCAIQYRLSQPLPMAASSTMLEIEKLPGLDLVQMLARVSWSRKTGNGSYTSGLKFRRNLPDRFVCEDARKGLHSRRASSRASVNVSVRVHQNEPAVNIGANILNTSDGGIQILGPEPLSIGSRLLLQLADGTVALGKTAWTSESGSEFASGIAFMNRASGRIFNDTVRSVTNYPG